MTEQMAIEVLNGTIDDINQVIIARATAVVALQEIQKYKTIGTVEELYALKEKSVERVNMAKSNLILIKTLRDSAKYYKGTGLQVSLNDAADALETYEWIPVDEKMPNTGEYILLSFENFTVPVIGRYEQDVEGGAFYAGDEDVSLVAQDMIVNAWMRLPERYNPRVCTNEECPYNTKGDCAAASGCAGYEEA